MECKTILPVHGDVWGSSATQKLRTLLRDPGATRDSYPEYQGRDNLQKIGMQAAILPSGFQCLWCQGTPATYKGEVLSVEAVCERYRSKFSAAEVAEKAGVSAKPSAAEVAPAVPSAAEVASKAVLKPARDRRDFRAHPYQDHSNRERERLERARGECFMPGEQYAWQHEHWLRSVYATELQHFVAVAPVDVLQDVVSYARQAMETCRHWTY